MVVAPDEEKNPFLLRMKSGPDRDTMSPIKRALPGWYIIRRPALSFLVMGGPARCSRDTAKVAVFRLASTHPDRRPVPVDGKM
jgi:hypothetical protein